MCGIVGYVGRRPGKPIILDGLRRLEYRGYDSAGIALIESRWHRDRCAPSVTSTRSSRPRVRTGPRPTSVSATLAGRRTAGPARRTPTRTPTAAAGSPSSSTASSRTTRSCATSSPVRGHVFSSETDAEVVVHLIEEHIVPGLTEAVRTAVGSLEGHYAFCAISADEPDIVVGTRNECPLVVGVGEDEMFFASAIPAFLAHTSKVGRARRRRRRHAPRRRRGVLRRRGLFAGPRGDHRPLGRRRRGEGRLRDLHAQGDPRAARGTARHARRTPAGGRRRRPLGGRAGRRDAAPPAAHLHRRLRHLLPRRADRQLRDRAAGPRAGADRRGQRVPLSRAGVRRRHAGHRHHAVG